MPQEITGIEVSSKEWHAFRLAGIGSSDAPVIMSVSPWKTRFQLWQEKTGQVERDQSSNFQMRRGNQLEPKARARYELETGYEMPPLLVMNEKFPFLRASMDGFNKTLNRGLEIKCPGKEDHAKALSGEIPEKYKPQLMHQILVTGADAIDYYSFDGNSGICVEVLPDAKYIQQLFKEEMHFWALVVARIPPDLKDEDFSPIEDQKQIARLMEWKLLQSEISRLSEKSDGLKQQILKNLKHKRMVGAGVKIYPQVRQGSIEYSRIPELEGVDLEPYRKSSLEYYTIRPMKED